MYLHLVPLLLPVSALIYLPLGALDALGDQFDHVSIEKFDVVTGLLVFGGFGQFVLAAFGDVFYSGFVAAAVLARTGHRRHPLKEILLKLPYLRLLVADFVVTIATAIGLALLVVPGVVLFVWFSLTAPVIKVEDRGVFAAMRRSRRLTRGSFWTVLVLLGGLYIASNALTSTAQGIAAGAIGHRFFAHWAAALAMGVIVEPIVAVATVVVALELIELRGPAAYARPVEDAAPVPEDARHA
jgi:Uncharacterised protein family (UPF0259)